MWSHTDPPFTTNSMKYVVKGLCTSICVYGFTHNDIPMFQFRAYSVLPDLLSTVPKVLITLRDSSALPLRAHAWQGKLSLNPQPTWALNAPQHKATSASLLLQASLSLILWSAVVVGRLWRPCNLCVETYNLICFVHLQYNFQYIITIAAMSE